MDNSFLGPLLGRSVRISFSSGFAVSADYLSEARVRWRNGVLSGEETIHAARPDEDVVFVSWQEDNGTAVSHAINLRTNRLWAFVTYPTGDTRGVSFAEGEWVFE